MRQKLRKNISFYSFLLLFVMLFTGSANAATVKLNKTKATLNVGQKTTLKVKGNTKKLAVKWSSSKKKVATVSSKGVVKAVAPGKATIKAKVGKKTYSCKITVKNADAKAKSLKFRATSGGTFIAGASTATVSFKLSAASTNVSVVIKNSSDDTVYKKQYSKMSKGKTYQFTWNGKKSNGQTAEPGTYKVTVKAGTVSTTSGGLVIRSQEFAGGNGSASSPFLVQTWAQFLKTAAYNGAHFKQTADINCGFISFNGLFSESVPFTGTYDGNGKTISNLFITAADDAPAALFNASSGTVKNLTLYNVNVTGKKLAGILVGKNLGKLTGCTLNKCSVTSSVTGKDVWNGTLAEENAEGATIANCKVINSTASATSGWYHVWSGGLVGNNAGILIDSSISGSIVTTVSTSHGWAQGGGLVGRNTGNMMNCSADNVTISQKSWNCEWAAGIACENKGLISGCSFTNGTASNPGVHAQNGTFVE